MSPEGLLDYRNVNTQVSTPFLKGSGRKVFQAL